MNPVQQPVSGETEIGKVLHWDGNKKGDDYPMVGLTYEEKQAYCQSLGAHLPTAAQIERAARGVSGTDEYGTPIDKAILRENGARGTAPVCGVNDERANSFGVCDLAGNVWESALDAFDENFYNHLSSTDPVNPLTDTRQREELRGGSYLDNRGDARAANRRSVGSPLDRDYRDGFRCARPRAPKKQIF